jgi:hypothetical protein
MIGFGWSERIPSVGKVPRVINNLRLVILMIDLHAERRRRKNFVFVESCLEPSL